MGIDYDGILAIRWRDNRLNLLDQRQLPGETEWLLIDTAEQAAAAIADLVVRGAPAIGITAAYAAVLSVQQHERLPLQQFKQAVKQNLEHLAQARPTAVNLAWALAEMRRLLDAASDTAPGPFLQLARRIHQQDIQANQTIGELGAACIDPGSKVLTHCNTGSLATGGYGTALGVIRSAWTQGRLQAIYADETRPWLQGSRLTAWELQQDGIPVRLVVDGAGAWLMAVEGIHWLIVGADRVAANGDVANKIGTYHAAVAARQHGCQVMVAIPSSTLDLSLDSGDGIPIERRSQREITHYRGQRLAPPGSAAWNPVFDITPAGLVDVLVTEKGIVRNPNREKIRALFDPEGN